MLRWLLISAAALVCLWNAGSIAKAEPQPEPKEIDWGLKAEAATVQVYYGNHMGTGTVILPGIILTAAHLFQGESAAVVVFNDGRAAPAVPVYGNTLLDVAMLRVLGPTPEPIKINCTPLVRGEKFTWVGNPMGFEWNWGEGFVSSSKQNSISPWLVPVSAPFNHGDSGSGILNEDHELIGIVIGMMGENSSNGLVLPASNFCGISGALL